MTILLRVLSMLLLSSLACDPNRGTGACTAKADPDFVVPASHPVYSGALVVFDESHDPIHCISKSYRGTADTLRALGLEVQAGTLDTPADLKVLVTPRIPVSEQEAADLSAWVETGGRLLIAADHAPYGENLARLAAALGFGFGSEVVGPPGCAGSTGDACSRYEFENGVVTYAGVPVYGGEPLLVFGADAETAGGANAEGLAQATRAEIGSGRVVVLGEARVLSASSRGGIQVEANRLLLEQLVAWLME